MSRPDSRRSAQPHKPPRPQQGGRLLHQGGVFVVLLLPGGVSPPPALLAGQHPRHQRPFGAGVQVEGAALPPQLDEGAPGAQQVVRYRFLAELRGAIPSAQAGGGEDAAWAPTRAPAAASGPAKGVTSPERRSRYQHAWSSVTVIGFWLIGYSERTNVLRLAQCTSPLTAEVNRSIRIVVTVSAGDGEWDVAADLWHKPIRAPTAP